MVGFDQMSNSMANSMHSQDSPYSPYMPPSMHTPSRNDLHHHGQYPPASPYWSHLNISQLPGIAASPSVTHSSIHITPSKPPRYDPNSSRSYRGKRGSGRAGPPGSKPLIMFPNGTQSPASRFVMSPQDKNMSFYKNSGQPPSSSPPTLNQGRGQEESFVLPTIDNHSPKSPEDKAPAATSNTSMDLMPPSVKKLYGRMPPRPQDQKLSEVTES